MPVIQHQEMICGRGMSSDAGGRPEVKGILKVNSTGIRRVTHG